MYKYIQRNAEKILDRMPFTEQHFKAILTSTNAYVIYSFDTPIAVCVMRRWFINRKYHSELSTLHMNAVMSILQDAGLEVRLSNPGQFSDLLTAAGL